MGHTTATPAASRPSSVASSATLAHRSDATMANSGGAKPEPARTFNTPAADDPDGEEAEREFADFGGDVPSHLAMKKLRPRRGTTGSRTRTRSRSESLPPLFLVDSAFSESHRALSRISRLEAEEQGRESSSPSLPNPLPLPNATANGLSDMMEGSMDVRSQG